MEPRTIKLFPSSEYATTSTNTANVRSRVLEFTPPAGYFFAVPQSVAPVMKLKNTAGTEIDADGELFIGVDRDGQSSPLFAPGSIPYRDHADLTTANQRKAENRGPYGTLRHELGDVLMAEDASESIIVEINADLAIDFDAAGCTFELDVVFGKINE